MHKENLRPGTVIETLKYRQYTIRLDGSGRLSLRNRTHLKPIDRPTPTTPILQPVPPALGTLPADSAIFDNPVRHSSRLIKKPDFYCGYIMKN